MGGVFGGGGSTPAPPPPLPEPEPVSTAATEEQKRAAAKRRARGIQQRSLLSGARGGTADTGEQTTLGVG